jgi:hypothetical protein
MSENRILNCFRVKMPRSSDKNMKGAALILVTGAVRDADDETV